MLRRHSGASTPFRLALVLHLLATISAQNSNARSYDTNDWIPISRPCPTCGPNEKRPTGRVLNLPVSDQKQFLPTEVPVDKEEQPSQQQEKILLPPQLQTIISQGPHYLSPQRINAQLLQAQEIPVYQQQQAFQQNATDYNLDLYNQQRIPKPNRPQEDVQLLYVPLENLQQRDQRQQVVFPTEEPNRPPKQYQTPLQHKQTQLQNIQHDFIQQALQAQKLQQQFQHNIQPIPQVSTPPPRTPSKKRKPHQPPLAVYMGTEGHQDVKVGDVLALLKDAKTISVQDNISPNSPQVFVGPSHLEPPDGYAKFDLPYLSNIDGNRVERKVDQLPFFVAPLSYKAPQGYSKIPFPSPHVGSVIVNHVKATPVKEETEEIPTVRTRTRQRQPEVASTVPDYKHSSQSPEPNPYGPTQFIQPTTPSNYKKLVSLPDEIFSTRNRFPTITPSYRIQNPKLAQTSTTTSPPIPQTYSDDEKYTVLEEFEITPKPVTISQQVGQGSNRQQQAESNYAEKQFYQNVQTGNQKLPQFHYQQQTDEELPQFQRQQPIKPEIQQRPPIKQELPQFQHEQSSNQDLEEFQHQQTTLNQNVPQFQQQTQTTSQNVPQIQQQFANENLPQQQQSVNEDIPQFQHHQQQPTNQYSPQLQQQQAANQNLPQFQQKQPIIQEIPTRLYADQQLLVTPPQVQTNEEYVGVQYESTPSNYKTREQQIQYQQDVERPTPRSRGKLQFTPSYYADEYEADENTKSIEPQKVTSQYVATSPEENNQYLPDIKYKQTQQNQDYVLPAKLPAISPQLPGLVNSLEDQAIRPLLAPLLLPVSEEISATEPTTEYYPVSSTSTTTASTTTTSVPIIETTTPFKRTRGRQRVTRPTSSYDHGNTTPISRRIPSSYRGRRPYTSRTRQQTHDEVLQTSTVQHNEVELTTRPNYNRVQTTSPRSSNTRQRFRTRGRPIKSEEEFSERSTTEYLTTFKQPPFEGGFKASAPVFQQKVQEPIQYTQVPQDQQIYVQKPQQQQALVYVEDAKTNENIPKEYHLPSTEPIQQYHSEVTATSPENSIVADVTNHQSLALLNPTTSPQQVKYISTTYSEPTTEHSKTRVRGRGRPRPRGHSTTSTVTPPKRTTTVKQQESENEEFYGFFRVPQYEKPVQINHRPKPEYVQKQAPTVVYVQPTERPQNVYVSSTARLDDNKADSNVQAQYISSTYPPPEEAKPVTRRPTTANRRRPTSSVRSEGHTEAPKTIRVRGRIRKPIHPATTTPETLYANNEHYAQSPRSNELSNTEEHIVPARTKPRPSARGKSHFQHPASEKTAGEVESDNYPASYLQGQELAPKKLVVQEVFTTKPQFQLTIEPEEVDYVDQVSIPSVKKEKTATKDLEEVAESQYSPKVIDKPSNFNYIIPDEKTEKNATTEIVAQKLQLTTVSEVESKATDVPTTTEPQTTVQSEQTKPRRRGVWRLVKLRPVSEDFEPAESQNVGTIFANNLPSVDKPVPPAEPTTTSTSSPKDQEPDLFGPLFEMFGFTNESTDVEGTTVPGFEDNAWKTRIIGTSTTTEISHETEICYKGRCIKSTTTEASEQR